MNQAFERWWLAILHTARLKDTDSTAFKIVARAAFEAGRRHEKKKQEHIKAINEIIGD